VSALLSSSGLAVGYPGARGRELLSDVCIDVPRGKFICLIGPNGSGKSTLLSVLGGLMAPLRGTVMISGKDSCRMGNRERALAVSLVLPESPRPSWISGREVVSLGRYASTGFLGKASAEDEAAVDEAIQAMGAEKFASRPFSELSDGERQKLLMARAIAQGSPLLLMDEPTMYLDAPARTEAMATLRGIVRREGRSVVMALHEIDLALDWADELWIASRYEMRLLTGLPEELALRGAISAAYGYQPLSSADSPGIPYRAVSIADFIFPGAARTEGEKRIVISGGIGLEAFWTGRLVGRLGFRVDEGETVARVDILKGKGGPSWRLFTEKALVDRPDYSASGSRDYADMASLASALETILKA
jgi:iron complex transport system ATP-binding protein